MSWWQGFLDSLQSPGGKLFVIIIMLVWLAGIAVTLRLLGHGMEETGRTLFSNSFTALFTLLISYLSKEVKSGD